MMDIKKTISSTTVHGTRDSAGRDFRTQLNTDGVTDFYSCGNCIYIREEEK